MTPLGSHSRVATAVITAGLLATLGTLASPSVSAQWIRYPSDGAPRNADGTINMSAPTPRMPDGKPDLSGIWTSDEIDPRRPNEAPDPFAATTSRRMRNLGVELQGGLPYQPWVAALVKERTANNALDDPHVKCFPANFLRAYGMPHLIKFVQTPKLLLMLNEWNAGYRQIFTDARPLPEDPTPSIMGFSSATWQGDTLIVETNGVKDDTWIDWNGSILTEAAKVREEITRKDFGHVEIRVTVDDPKAYTTAWTVMVKERYVPDSELIDEVCLENERSLKHMKAAGE